VKKNSQSEQKATLPKEGEGEAGGGENAEKKNCRELILWNIAFGTADAEMNMQHAWASPAGREAWDEGHECD
jgi:hypothetical protein